MKKYRIRKGSIADKVVTTANKIDKEPFATITFMGVMMAMVAVFVVVINATYPIV